MKRPSLKRFRRVSQVSVLALMALVPVLNGKGLHWLSGNFFYFEAGGIPLGDPLAALQAFLSSGAWEWKALVGASCSLVLAALLGPVFCSWVCPFCLLSEVSYGLRTRTQDHSGVTSSRAFIFKLLLTGSGLGVIGLLGLPPLLSHLSMPGWYARISQQWTWEISGGSALILTGALVSEAFFARRIWCRWFCPQSVLLALSGRMSLWGLNVSYRPGSCCCSKEIPCRSACSLGLDPRRRGVASLECNNCGDCVDACSERGGALSLSWITKRRVGGRDHAAQSGSPVSTKQVPGS